MSKVENYLKDPAKISDFGEALTIHRGWHKYTITSLDKKGVYDTRKLNFNQKVVVYNEVYQKLNKCDGKWADFAKSAEFESWVKEVVKKIHKYAYPKIDARKLTKPHAIDTQALTNKISAMDREASVGILNKTVVEPKVHWGKDAIEELLKTNLGNCAQIFTSKNLSDPTIQKYLAEGVVVTYDVPEEDLAKMIPENEDHEGFVVQEFPHITARCDEVARAQFKDGKIHKLKDDNDKTSMGKGILQTKLPWDDVAVYADITTLETRMRYKKINNYGAGSPSNNRFAEDPHAMRVIEGPDGEGNMVPHAYAGRAETIEKAKKVVAFVFEQEFSANREKFVNDGSYHLSLAVQSLCKTEIFNDEEYEKFTLAERHAYEKLVANKTPISVEITDINGNKSTSTVILDEVFISNTALNGACYFQNRLLPEWWSHRKERSLETAKESDERLYTKIEGLNKESNPAYTSIKNQLGDNREGKEQIPGRRHLLQPWEELLLREYLYILAEVSAVKHCKSSKDRTGMALAIGSALRQWIAEHGPIDDVLALVQNNEFKELVLRKLLPGIVSSEYNTMTAGLKLAEPLRDPSLMIFLPDDCKKLYVFNAIFYGFILGLIAFPLVATLGIFTTLYRYTEEQFATPTSGFTLSSPVWEEYLMMFKDLWRMYDLWSHGLTPEAEKLIFGKLSKIDSGLDWLYKQSLKAIQKLRAEPSDESKHLLSLKEETND